MSGGAGAAQPPDNEPNATRSVAATVRPHAPHSLNRAHLGAANSQRKTEFDTPFPCARGSAIYVSARSNGAGIGIVVVGQFAQKFGDIVTRHADKTSHGWVGGTAAPALLPSTGRVPRTICGGKIIFFFFKKIKIIQTDPSGLRATPFTKSLYLAKFPGKQRNHATTAELNNFQAAAVTFSNRHANIRT